MKQMERLMPGVTDAKPIAIIRVYVDGRMRMEKILILTQCVVPAKRLVIFEMI